LTAISVPITAPIAAAIPTITRPPGPAAVSRSTTGFSQHAAKSAIAIPAAPR